MKQMYNYKYRSGDKIEIEIQPGKWEPGVFLGYQPFSVGGPHYFNVLHLSGYLTVPAEKVRNVGNGQNA